MTRLCWQTRLTGVRSKVPRSTLWCRNEGMISLIALKLATFAGTTLAVSALVYQLGRGTLKDLPNRIPEAAPYVITEATAFPPPYEQTWQDQDNPGQCQACHQKIFDEWNGSMMSNSWRDPVWRAAFLLLARATSAFGECDTPNPPDDTPKASHNPFATPGRCSSEFDAGTHTYTVSRPGSLLDGFCSRCHMPANYLDNVQLHNVKADAKSHYEGAPVDFNFNPTSDDGTGLAFAEVDSQYRNTDSGRIGVFCAICHTYAATRDTPFHNYERTGNEYYPATAQESRTEALDTAHQDIFEVADPGKRNLGYSIGGGSFRLSPHAIGIFEPFGPLAANEPVTPKDLNTSQIFGEDIPYQRIDNKKHK